MEIRRQNFVVTMDLYVATLSKKSLNKNVVTFLCSIATMIQENGSREVSRQSNLCCGITSLRGEKECCDKTKLCRDRKWQSNETSQDKLVTTKVFYVATNISTIDKIKAENMS